MDVLNRLELGLIAGRANAALRRFPALRSVVDADAGGVEQALEQVGHRFREDFLLVTHRLGIVDREEDIDLVDGVLPHFGGEAGLRRGLLADDGPAQTAFSEGREHAQNDGPAEGVSVEEVEDIVYVFGAGAAATRLADAIDDPNRAFLRPGNLEDVFLRLTGRGLLD